MAEPLKNAIDADYLLKLGREIGRFQKSFSATQFKNECVSKDWPELALKERITRVTQTLGNQLPGTYRQKILVLKKAAPIFSSYTAFYFPEFVSTFGMSAKDRMLSLDALRIFTRYSSSEFAVRSFIEQDSIKTMAWMTELASSSNEHERRLASEGCRPKLPWGTHLQEFIKDPSPLFPILDLLIDDPSLYVRRSVANNLNDISKDHPKKVLTWVKNQLAERGSSQVRWVAQHSLRTLLKRGNEDALKILGYDVKPPIKISNFCISKTNLQMGDRLEFSITFNNMSAKAVPLLVKYILHFKKKMGSTNPKVFNLKKFVLRPKEASTIAKKHLFVDLSTREHHLGEHFLEIQYNGVLSEKKTFYLEPIKVTNKKKTKKKKVSKK